MKRQLCLVLALLVMFAALYGCAAKAQLAADTALEISGEDVAVTLTADQMQSREQKTIKCTNIAPGEIVKEVTVSGFSLRDVLAENGISLDELASLNLIASDGYSVIVPPEYYIGSDVYILLKLEGENLSYPTSCLPDQRSMYWVKDLAKIELLGKDAAGKTGQ